ncbi:MAG TPA: YopT-type cysteine protease domain-containing protein [Bryobacteraceae bacterium]|nr:YopT-type cysteine protease domain-containing protein [Bryobacteraceae bacterium]
MRPFNQALVFQSGADTASLEGVCIGCSALYLKNEKPWEEFKTFLTSEAGQAKARRISNGIFRREKEISEEATRKRQALVEEHRTRGLAHQEGSKQFAKDYFGVGNATEREAARKKEQANNLKTAEEAHKYRMSSYQEWLCTPPLSLGLGRQQDGPSGAFTEIPDALFTSGLAKKVEAGCLVGMWSKTQIGERTGRLSQGHAIAVKPTQDAGGFAVFDPNFGEVRFNSDSHCRNFLVGFIGTAAAFVNGSWMVQEYFGCPPVAEKVSEEVEGLSMVR